MAWRGAAWRGVARQGRRGVAGQGKAGQGVAYCATNERRNMKLTKVTIVEGAATVQLYPPAKRALAIAADICDELTINAIARKDLTIPARDAAAGIHNLMVALDLIPPKAGG